MNQSRKKEKNRQVKTEFLPRCQPFCYVNIIAYFTVRIKNTLPQDLFNYKVGCKEYTYHYDTFYILKISIIRFNQ